MRRTVNWELLLSFTLTLLLILLAVVGCVKPQSTPNLTPESNRHSVSSQTGLSKSEYSPAVTELSLHIIIYTDYECGACEKFYSEVEPELRKRYEETGKAQIEMRLLGLISDDSLRAAEAALCAADQGLFLEYQEALFYAWRHIDSYAYSAEELLKLAETVGLDVETFQASLESGSKKQQLQKNLSLAKADGVRVLPTVIIDGVKVHGYKPLDTYIKLIEQSETSGP